MKRTGIRMALLLSSATWVAALGTAQVTPPSPIEVYQQEPPPMAEPGYTWVKEVRFKEVKHPYCKMVPDKRYTWIYDTRPDYYCIPSSSLSFLRKGNENPNCPNCNGPYYRPQLKKMMIEKDYGLKCVVDYATEYVPEVAWRKVRIGAEGEKGKVREMLPRPAPLPMQPKKVP